MERSRPALALTVVACCVVLAAGWWVKARCLDDGVWTGGEQYTSWCYTDVFPLWFAEHLDEGAVPYLDHPVEYPVLTGAQMWAVAQAVEDADDPAVAFFHATAALAAAAALGTLALLALAGLPARRLLWWAAAPTLALAAFVNWDTVPVALLVAGVVAHRAHRDGLAGVAAGLGAAAKLFPAVLVPVVVVARLVQRRPRQALVHAGAAAAAWLAVNLPVALTAPGGWWQVVAFNRARPADWDSLWRLGEWLGGTGMAVATLNAASGAAFLVGGAAIVVVGTRTRPPWRLWEVTLPLLACLLLTSKVYSPQFSLWLLPLMPLTLTRLAPFVGFLAADAAVFLVRFPFLGGVEGWEPSLGYGWLAAAVVVRAAALGWVAVDVLRR